MQRNPDPIQLEAQEVLDRQVVQLTRLVDDLLDVSRISTGSVRLRIEPVDLREVVRRAVEIVRPQVDRKGQTLTLSLARRSCGRLGDDVRLQQVVVNLLDNANKYTDRGGLLTIELRTEGDEAVLCVRDNGIGIEPRSPSPHIRLVHSGGSVADPVARRSGRRARARTIAGCHARRTNRGAQRAGTRERVHRETPCAQLRARATLSLRAKSCGRRLMHSECWS